MVKDMYCDAIGMTKGDRCSDCEHTKKSKKTACFKHGQYGSCCGFNTTPVEGKKLNRFTSLDSLVRIIRDGKMQFSDPSRWSDGNDVYFLNQFKEKRGKDKKIRALCFLNGSETSHHWEVYAKSGMGVCIEFNMADFKRKLEETAEKLKAGGGFLDYGDVHYQTIDSMKKQCFCVDMWPFLKRYPYGDEREFRVVYLGDDEVAIENVLPCIKKITFESNFPDAVYDVIKGWIQGELGMEEDSINKSTLCNNDDWKTALNEMMELQKKMNCMRM